VAVVEKRKRLTARQSAPLSLVYAVSFVTLARRKPTKTPLLTQTSGLSYSCIRSVFGLRVRYLCLSRSALQLIGSSVFDTQKLHLEHQSRARGNDGRVSPDAWM